MSFLLNYSQVYELLMKGWPIINISEAPGFKTWD